MAKRPWNIFFWFGWGREPNPVPVPTAYYTMDEWSGTTAFDSVGDNDWSIVWATWTTGKINDWLEFDGDGDYVDIWNISWLFTDQASISMWVKLNVATPTNSEQTWIMRISDSDDTSHYPFTDWLAYFNTFKTSRFDWISLSTNVDRTQWHLLTITTEPWDNWWKLYQNTELVYQNTWENSVSIDSNSYLWRNWTGNRLFDWLMDEVWIWNQALTQEQITYLYNDWDAARPAGV